MVKSNLLPATIKGNPRLTTMTRGVEKNDAHREVEELYIRSCINVELANYTISDIVPLANSPSNPFIDS